MSQDSSFIGDEVAFCEKNWIVSVLAFIACYRIIFQRLVVKTPVFMENERNFAKSEAGCVPPLYCFAEPFPPFLNF